MKTIGIILIVVALIGMLMAIGNLVGVHFTQTQLQQSQPDSAGLIDQAVAISRTKSYIGMAGFTLTLILGVALVRVGSRRRRTQGNPIDRGTVGP